MQRLTLDLVRPSFVLAKPAMDDKERTLIAEGTTLTEAQIEALRKRGVSAVFVVGHPVDMGGESAKTTPEQRRAYIEQAFSRHAGNPAMSRFKQAFMEQIALKAKREEAARGAEAMLGDTATKAKA